MPARDPWFDNAKMALVLLVVVGHLWALLPEDGLGGRLYDLLYLWHMPAFVFLSGYLSRSFTWAPHRLWQLVSTLLVPYLLFEGLLGWFRVHVGGEDLSALWADPHFPLWYLLALAAWRLVTPLLLRLPAAGAVALAVAVSAAGGFVSGDLALYLDLSRILGFLPFFVLGLVARPAWFDVLRRRSSVAPALGALSVVVLVGADFGSWGNRSMLYYRPYDVSGDADLTAVLLRLLLIGVGVLGTAAFLPLVARRGGWFTRMGAATMVVYVFHGFAVKALEYAGFPAWADTRPLTALLVATGLGVAVALLLASPPVRRVLGHVVDPFSTAQRQVREAVELAVVVREREDDRDGVAAGR